MSDFVLPYSGLTNNGMLTDAEVISAVSISEEAKYEAAQLYMPLAESIQNKLTVQVLKEIADEELVNAGDFLRLLRELALADEKHFAKGPNREEENFKMKK